MRKENRNTEMGGKRKDNRVKRTPREKAKTQEEWRGQEEHGKHTRKFQTGAGLHIPWPCFVLSLCPSSERSPGTAPAPRLRAPSPLSTTLIHLSLCLSSSEIPLPFFFSFCICAGSFVTPAGTIKKWILQVQRVHISLQKVGMAPDKPIWKWNSFRRPLGVLYSLLS